MDSRRQRSYDNNKMEPGLPFELAEPILIHTVRLLRPTHPQTRRLLPLDTQSDESAAITTKRHPDLALTDILLATHPSTLLCTTLLPRLSWFTPDRTLKTQNVQFVDVWARSQSVSPYVFDIPLDLATWCFAHAAPPHVLDWLTRMFSVGEIVSTKSITALFDTVTSEEQALQSLKWWADRAPLDKEGHAVRVRLAVREAARAAFTRVLDWLMTCVPLARFASVLDGALGTTARDPVRVLEWWIQQRASANVLTSMAQWMRQGQQSVFLLDGSTFIDSVSALGCIAVLDWWRSSQFSSPTASVLESLDYTHRSIDTASEVGNLDVLNWWKSQSPALELRYTELAMDKADSTAVLDWWIHESKLPLKFTSFAMTYAVRSSRNTSILDWWLARNKQLGVTYSPTTLHDSMELAMQGLRGGRVNDVRNWVSMTWFAKHWQETGQAISQGFLIKASVDPNQAWFLKWWSDNKLPLKIFPEARQYAYQKEWWDIVAWWDAQERLVQEGICMPGKKEMEFRRESHAAVMRHEKECLDMLHIMLRDLALTADN